MRRELDGLSFQPQISRVSQRIHQQKLQGGVGTPVSKYESLYEDAMRRRERQQFIYSACIEAECTFAPNRDKTRYTNYNTNVQQSPKESTEVFERLSNRLNSSCDRSRIVIENSRSLNNELFDPETGQELFKPLIGRAPKHHQPGSSRTRGKKLYKEAL